MSILETVEASLTHFHPKTPRQFVVFHIARRFQDLPNLARYLNVANSGHPKRVLLEAARLAEQRADGNVTTAAAMFFTLLEEWRKEAS